MDLSANVLLRVIYNVVNIFPAQIVVRHSIVSVDSRAELYVLENLCLQGLALCIWHNLGSDVACIAIQHPDYYSLASHAACVPCDSRITFALIAVHVPHLPTKERLIYFHFVFGSADLVHRSAT